MGFSCLHPQVGTYVLRCPLCVLYVDKCISMNLVRFRFNVRGQTASLVLVWPSGGRLMGFDCLCFMTLVSTELVDSIH